MTRAEVWVKNCAKNWVNFSTGFRASFAVQNDPQIFSPNSSPFITPCLVAEILKFHLCELLGLRAATQVSESSLCRCTPSQISQNLSSFAQIFWDLSGMPRAEVLRNFHMFSKSASVQAMNVSILDVKHIMCSPRQDISMPNMTGRPGCRTMEMNGGSSASYLACTPCVPLFVLCLIGVETEGLLDLPREGGDHIHCAVEPSPGHIRCPILKWSQPMRTSETALVKSVLWAMRVHKLDLCKQQPTAFYLSSLAQTRNSRFGTANEGTEMEAKSDRQVGRERERELRAYPRIILGVQMSCSGFLG